MSVPKHFDVSVYFLGEGTTARLAGIVYNLERIVRTLSYRLGGSETFGGIPDGVVATLAELIRRPRLLF